MTVPEQADVVWWRARAEAVEFTNGTNETARREIEALLELAGARNPRVFAGPRDRLHVTFEFRHSDDGTSQSAAAELLTFGPWRVLSTSRAVSV